MYHPGLRRLALDECPCPTCSEVKDTTLGAGRLAVPWHAWELSWAGGHSPPFGKGHLVRLSPLLGRSNRQQSAWRGTSWTAAS